MRTLGALVAVLLSGAVLESSPRGESPHGQADRCASCHAPASPGDGPEQLIWTLGSPDGSCMACHDEVPHQVGMRPDHAEVPEDLLLMDGRMACFTCHREPSCDGEGLHPENAQFFRGGPYAKVGELCARCHVDTAERYDPHAPQAKYLETQDDTSCLHCHARLPVGPSDLRVSSQTMCLGCHQQELVHAGSVEHLVPLEEPMLARATAAGLPTGNDGEVYCGTCHAPHPAGVLEGSHPEIVGEALFPEAWNTEVLEPTLKDRAEVEPQVMLEPDYLRLPLTGGELCLACHSVEDVDRSRSTP